MVRDIAIELVFANNGREAVELYQSFHPDLIFMDISMPEMDGLSVARRLSKHETRPAVIFVTAHDDFAVEAFDLEAVDYVLKPVTPERLERAVNRAAARRGSRRSDTGKWLSEFWVPHRSELIRIEVPGFGSAAEVPGPDLPDEVPAVLQVVLRQPALARVVGEATLLCSRVHRLHRRATQRSEAHG